MLNKQVLTLYQVSSKTDNHLKKNLNNYLQEHQQDDKGVTEYNMNDICLNASVENNCATYIHGRSFRHPFRLCYNIVSEKFVS